jgi:hypothetical protein
VLGDARRDERAEWMLERIVASGSLVLRELGGTRSGEMAAHRLLSSDEVHPNALLQVTSPSGAPPSPIHSCRAVSSRQ